LDYTPEIYSMQRMLKPQKAFNATDIKHSMLHCMACKGREGERERQTLQWAARLQKGQGRKVM
jgi:hypothetical protein